jgi:hypothetical protein
MTRLSLSALLVLLLACSAWGQECWITHSPQQATFTIYPPAPEHVMISCGLPSEPLPLGPRPVERIEVEVEKCFGCWRGGTASPYASVYEPMDVPAIQVEKIVGLVKLCPPTRNFCTDSDRDIWHERFGLVWTCADKSRILLTDESGRKHCVRFTSSK